MIVVRFGVWFVLGVPGCTAGLSCPGQSISKTCKHIIFQVFSSLDNG